MDERQDQFDQALDEALASYGNAPAREGLEGRVLARVTQRATPSRPRLPFAVAICTFAVAWCLIWLRPGSSLVPKRPVENAAPAISNIESRTLTIHTTRPRTALAIAKRRRRTWKESVEPKLPHFPTPLPISSEERALLRLTENERRNLARELSYLDGPIEPIQVKAIEIRPLE